ncbi:MAG: S41 family peptidase [Verrucomicrobiia bacterium]
MMMLRNAWPAAAGFALVVLAANVRAADASGPAWPPFSEVYGVLRSNLVGASESELNGAAVAGLLSHLADRAMLVTNSASAAEAGSTPLVAKSIAFDQHFAFVRVSKVAPGLAEQIRTGYTQLASTNQLKGVVLDLRFAGGTDYAAAAAAADLFVPGEQPLLDWGSATARSSGKPVADLPLVLLINRETVGAAEALAEVLRETVGALTIGSASAGRAYTFQEFPLSNGAILRVASGAVTAGRDHKLGSAGLQPDIRIAVKPEDERAYFEDPYAVLATPFAQSARAGTNDLSSLINRSRRRNEADLVRMQREGIDFEVEPASMSPPEPTEPVVSDPALSRALDLLKGLALAAKRQ